jgi:hypothetical protein
MAKKSRYKYKVGLIVAIPLPDGRFAFAKLFNDLDFGVYSLLSEKIEPVEKIVEHEIVFFQSATDSAVVSGEWPIVGEEPFPDEEPAWGPPKAAGTLPQTGVGPPSPMMYHKGEMKSARIEDLIGLDIEKFCQRPERFVTVLVNRLIKGDHSEYRVQP